MLKAGCMGAGLGFIYIMGLTLLSPLCTLCLTPLLGLSVGYTAGWFDQPARVETSLSKGIVAGGFTGLGVILGQLAAAVVNGILVTNSRELTKMINELGFSQAVITNPGDYWQATLLINSFCGVLNLALLVGLGALGGVIWFQKHRATPVSGL
jgi:hypothetical protein